MVIKKNKSCKLAKLSLLCATHSSQNIPQRLSFSRKQFRLSFKVVLPALHPSLSWRQHLSSRTVCRCLRCQVDISHGLDLPRGNEKRTLRACGDNLAKCQVPRILCPMTLCRQYGEDRNRRQPKHFSCRPSCQCKFGLNTVTH